MILLITPFSLMLSFIFTRLQNPLSIGLTLLIQTLVISLAAGRFSFSYWFSYILFIIFIGGILVLFIYVASLAANEYFIFSISRFVLGLRIRILLFLILFIRDPLVISSYSSLPISSFIELSSSQKIIRWIYRIPLIRLTLFVIIYLLLALIVVVKIVNLYKGPLRLLY